MAQQSLLKAGDRVVHGMLGASLFSAIIGTCYHGAVYLSQSLDFRQPILVDDQVNAAVELCRIRNRM